MLPTSEVKRGAGALCVKSTLEVKGTPRQGGALSLSPSRLVGRPTLHKGASQHLGELSQPREKGSYLKQSHQHAMTFTHHLTCKVCTL